MSRLIAAATSYALGSSCVTESTAVTQSFATSRERSTEKPTRRSGRSSAAPAVAPSKRARARSPTHPLRIAAASSSQGPQCILPRRERLGQGGRVRGRGLRLLGPRPRLLEGAARGPAGGAARLPDPLVVRLRRRPGLGGARLARAAPLRGLAPPRAPDRRRGAAARGKLAHLPVGDRDRPRARDEPRLLRESARERGARRGLPARAALAGAGPGARARQRRRARARRSARRGAVDPARPRDDLRRLRAR